MRSQLPIRCLAITLGLACGPAMSQAQIPHNGSPSESTVTTVSAIDATAASSVAAEVRTRGAAQLDAPADDIHAIPPQFNLSGPRLGATFSRDGEVRSQFGWHFEKQIEASRRGPWLVIESVLLAGGLEQRQFIPTWTVIFGMRLPNGVEFGLGPNVTILPRGGGMSSSVVLAAGRTFRINGIQLPLNLAYAFDKNGERVTLIAGWAVRHPDEFVD